MKKLNQNQEETPDFDTPDMPEKTPMMRRILAGIGALLMLLLVIMYTYSIATGKIFLW